MYNLPYHKENDLEVLTSFINQYPFAFLTGCDSQHRPVATQVPLFLEDRAGKLFLSGHIMRNTDHHKAFLQNEYVLAVFTGHHVYVSGTWYSNPHLPSTWNYMSVHIKGAIRFVDNEALEQLLQKTTLHFENYNQASTTVFDNVSADIKKRVMHMIVAFEIEVMDIDNVFKLSQDRDFESYQNIQAKLKEQGEAGKAIAAEMEKRTKDVFPDRD